MYSLWVQAWPPQPQQPAQQLKIYVYELPFALAQMQVLQPP